MQVQYDGAHSIVFGRLGAAYELDADGFLKGHSSINGKHTWNDWHLIPELRPVATPPSPVTRVVSIPGQNGFVDFSKLLTGYMTYQNRSGSWTFIVDNNQWESWEIAYTTILDYLHGESLVCYFTDEPEFYYEGLFSVESAGSTNSWSTITINYNLNPYKRLIQATNEHWLWDPFNFETGVITDNCSGIIVPANSSSNGVRVEIPVFEEPVKPVVNCTVGNGAVTLDINGKTFSLLSGEHRYRGLTLAAGSLTTIGDEQRVIIGILKNSSGSNAMVSFIFRGGEL